MSRPPGEEPRMPLGAPPVVVLNMHYSGLGIARNLAPLGVRVFGMSANGRFPGNRSRFCEFVRSPDSLAQPSELRDFLLEFASTLRQKPVLFPTRDHDVQFINAHRNALDVAYEIPFSAPDVIDRIMNKDRCFAAASTCDIAVPRGVTLRSGQDLPLARDLRFPVVCKPLYASQWRKPGIWELVGGQKAVKLDDFDSLAALYGAVAPKDPIVTVQEWIPGPESNLVIFGSYADRSGDVVARFTARKRLQYPALLGTGVVVESCEIPAIETPSRLLLKTLGFCGISEIEYKIDERDGKPYLIEINPRHWDQHRLGAVCGVNLSEVAYRDAIGQPARKMVQRADVVRWIADYDYAMHLVRCVLGKASLTEAIGWLRGPTTYSTLDARDWVPTLSLAANVLRDLFGSVRHRLSEWR